MIKNLPFIYEDGQVLVINKPAGLSVHKDERGQPADTLLDRLLADYPEAKLVHRLDRDTSGVMIVAKNEKAHEFLKKQFQNHQVRKVYHAILSGSLKMGQGEERKIILPIGRSKNDPRRRVASAKAAGELRPAETIFRLLENLGDNYAYVEAEPKTGRTHQLRAHFKAYNHPIIGDFLYNPKDDGGGLIKRQALHAYQLTIKIPNFAEASSDVLGEVEHTFEAPLPSDFVCTLEKLRASC